MKRIYFILFALALLCTACQDDLYDATYISKTEIAAHSSTADVLIYVCDQDGQRSRAIVEEFGVFLSTNPNPTDKDERRSYVIEDSEAYTYKQVYNELGCYGCTINGLSANTTYYALPFISNRWGVVTGKVVSFTTNGTATVTTKAATQITTTSAQLNATVQVVGENVNLEKRGFVISTSNNPTIEGANVTNWAEVGKAGDYAVSFTGLNGGTRYYFRGYVMVDKEVLYGNVLNFTTTTPDDKITMSLNDVTDVTASGANVSGSITIGKDIVGQMTECGFLCSTNSNPTAYSYDSKWYYDSNTNNDFSTWSGKKNLSGKFSNLSQNTTYYYRMYYYMGGQYYYDSTVKSFRTSGGSQSYYTVSQIMSIYNSLDLSSGSTSTDTYTVRGYVTQWISGYPNWQNADFWIDDSANGSTSRLKCFRLTGVLDSDKRTLNVGDYIEAQNCHLMNYNGIAELKDGTFTVIKEASQGSTLGSQVSDFVGTYSASAYNVDLQKYESWNNVEIYTFNNSNTNSDWIAVSGLNAGYDYAIGEFDATNKALKLYSDYTFTNATYTLEGKGDTTFISYFYPIFVNKTDDNFDSWHVILYGNGYEGRGEAWLTFNSSGELVLGAAATTDTDGYYANGMNFACYYATTGNFYYWEYAYVEVTLTKTSSSVSAPKRNRTLKQWHAPMRLPQKEKAVSPKRLK